MKTWPYQLVWSAALFLWGLAEATLFFIVPDVLLSFAVVKTRKRDWMLWLIAATSGAIVGAELMYVWGSLDGNASALVEKIPAISPEMMSEVYKMLQDEPLIPSLLQAGVTGIPIKTASVMAPLAGITLGQLVLAVLIARLARFSLAISGAALYAHLTRNWSSKQRMSVLALLWGIFYLGFFCLMPN